MIPEYNEGQEIYLEHMTRYIFASQFVENKVVLDIACGSGYGANHLLKSGAKKVFGVDISEETISYCKERYANQELEFLVGDVKKIPIEDKSIDVVVSFETIEHVNEDDQKIFLKEIKRILSPNGIFIVSTPNSLVYGKGNPFHLKELNPEEFKDILKNNFKNTEIFYQDNVESSYIYSQEFLEELNDKAEVGKKIDTIRAVDSMYLISVCGDSELGEIRGYASLSNIKPRIQYMDIAKDIQESKNKEIELKNIELSSKDEEILNKNQEIDALKNSTSWKITKPIRLAMEKIKRLKYLIRLFFEVFKKDGILVPIKKIFFSLKNKILTGIDLLASNFLFLFKKDKNFSFKKDTKLIMTLLVRDEIDIIKQNIEFHFANGVDFIIATDNGSVDGTREVLLEYQNRGRLELINEISQDYSQAEWVNRMGNLAFKKYKASFVFHCDADEFWFSSSGNLKNEIKNSREDVLMVNIANVLLEDKNGEESFPADMRYAVIKPLESLNLERDSINNNLYLFRYPPKVIFRKNFKVIQGNHDVLGVIRANKRFSSDIIIYHYPVRSKKHFFQKIINGGSSYLANKKLNKKIGWHWRRWYDAYNDGVLEREYCKLILKKEEVKLLVKDKTIELVPFKVINK